MAFKIQVTGAPELSKRQFVTEVVIERRIYEHTRARIVMRWDEHTAYSDQQTAMLAAKTLNARIDVNWKDNDLNEDVPCFHGYVENAVGRRNATGSGLELECVSYSKRTDLVPRFRAFQACKLSDICSQIAKTESLIKTDNDKDLNFDIDLSLQYGETDFEYLARMLHAWGVPMAVDDMTGEVHLGARGKPSSGKFPDIQFGWSEVAFLGGLHALPKPESSGSGPSGAARGKVSEFNGQLKPKASDYFMQESYHPDYPDYHTIGERVSSVRSMVDPVNYRLRLDSAVLPFSPGQVVHFENQDHIVRRVFIEGSPREATATQTFELQPYTLPYQPYRTVPKWPNRTLWAWVMENENDPKQSGRIQVKFDFEPLDPPSSSERAWLPMLTPYGGGKSPSQDKAVQYNGFYSLPEVGERVLVEFLGDWDCEAVVVGAVRHASVSPMFNAKDTKRWRTPSGNEVTLTTKGTTEVVRVRCKDKIFFESKIDGPSAEVYITPGESDGDIIHFKKGGGPSTLNVLCDGMINMIAKQKLHLEGQLVQIKASGGNVNIDGAPNVMINCVPIPATPLVKQKFEEVKMSTKSKPRKMPTPPVATAAAAGAGAATTQQDKQADKKKTWIEIVLKDDRGKPVPGEKYRIKLPDGSIREGTLNAEGKARVDGIDPGTAQVSFPEIDANDWRPA